jgi:hypothetical protein
MRIGEKGKGKAISLYFNKKFLKKFKTLLPHVQSSLIHNSQDMKQLLYPSMGRWIKVIMVCSCIYIPLAIYTHAYTYKAKYYKHYLPPFEEH